MNPWWRWLRHNRLAALSVHVRPQLERIPAAREEANRAERPLHHFRRQCGLQQKRRQEGQHDVEADADAEARECARKRGRRGAEQDGRGNGVDPHRGHDAHKADEAGLCLGGGQPESSDTSL